MRINYAQTSFTGGEWSPRLNGQFDQKKYFTACSQLENMLIQTHGPITRRPGTRFIAEVKTSAKKVRLVPFEFSSIQAYILEFGDLYIRFFKDRGQIVDSSIILDLMEYATDTAVQAAFVSNAAGSYGSDVLTGGTASDYPGHWGAQTPDLAVDDNNATYWQSDQYNYCTWKYDLGAGVTKQVQKLVLTIMNVFFTTFYLHGSNDNSAWTLVLTGDMTGYSTRTFTFSNATAYRYYKLIPTTINAIIYEVEMMELLSLELQDYSEAAIKQEGSYSLKGVTTITASLNKTLTRTVSPVIDLTGKNIIKFDILSSRTGSNIKIGIHDSGGTTTENTPNIIATNTWQTVTWDISAIANADKNAIDSIIITIVNADVANTFYIDNMFGDAVVPNPYEIVSPYTETDLETLWFIQSADTMYLTHPLYAPQKLTRTGHAAWALNEINFVDGPYLTENITGITLQPSGTTGSITLTAVPVIGAEKVVNGAFATNGTWTWGTGWAFDGTDFEADHTAGNTAALEQDVTAVAAKTYLVVFTIKNRTAGSVVPSVGGTNGPTRQANATYSQTILAINADNLKFTPTTDFDGSIDDVSVKETSGVADIFQAGHVGSIWRIKQGTTWGYVKITTVTDNLHAVATVQGTTALGGTAAVTTWREGAWSGVRGYPTCCAFHEERLVFAGTTDQPQTIWGSKSGDFENFAPEATITDAGPFTYSLASDQVNTIRWLCSSRLLMAGTISGEWKIAASSLTAPITPTDISVRKDTSYGSSTVRPQPVGNVVLFVQRQGRKVRELAYSYADDCYVAPDMSLISEHITTGGITRIDYQREPDQTLWCIRGDGVLLSMVYERPQEVVGWSKHITDGLWESVAIIPGITQDEVWLVANRTIGGVTKRYVELLQPVDWGTDQKDCFFVDCGLSYDTTPAVLVSTVTFPHLKGETIAILADGAPQTNKVVDIITGVVTLDPPAYVVHGGLPFTPKFKNLPPEVPTQTGTSQGLTKKINKIILRLKDTLGIKIGPDEANLADVSFRTISDLMDAPPPLFTGDYEVEYPGSYEKTGQFCIQQDQPLPFTLQAIILQMEITG